MSKTKAKKAESGSKSARRSSGKKNLKLARAAKKSAKANARRKAAAPQPRRGRAPVADKVIHTVSPPVQPMASPVQQEIIIQKKFDVTHRKQMCQFLNKLPAIPISSPRNSARPRSRPIAEYPG